MAETRGVVTRFRGKEMGCFGCLRVTIGTEAEVTRFLKELKSVLAEIHSGKAANGVSQGQEEKKEQDANGVVA